MVVIERIFHTARVKAIAITEETNDPKVISLKTDTNHPAQHKVTIKYKFDLTTPYYLKT